MKLNQVLKLSLTEPLPSAAELIAAANRRKSSSKRIAVVAAVAAMLVLSVSATVALSGFERAFTVAIDSGEISVIAESSENSEFEIEVNEIWFDAQNLFVGGSVTTPEPLDVGRSYELIADYKIDGGEVLPAIARIYPSGDEKSVFVLSSWQYGDGMSVGTVGERAEIALRFERICDCSTELEEGHIDDFTAYFGEVRLLLDAKSAEKSPLRGELDDISATLNEFTLELVGKLGEHHAIFVKLDDGRLIGREQGEISRSIAAGDRLYMTFAEPIELERVKSVLIVGEWYTLPDEAGGEEVVEVRLEIPLG